MHFHGSDPFHADPVHADPLHVHGDPIHGDPLHESADMYGGLHDPAHPEASTADHSLDPATGHPHEAGADPAHPHDADHPAGNLGFHLPSALCGLVGPYLPHLHGAFEHHGRAHDSLGRHAPHLDRTHAVDGTPHLDAHFWHEQAHDNTCAIVSQQSVIEELTGHHLTENGLMQEAANHGWYTPGPNGGTPLLYTGCLLEAYGIHVRQQHDRTMADLANELHHDHKVIVGLNGEMIWNPESAGHGSLWSFIGIPGQRANHAVEVIGIDRTDPHHPQVILNDSGTPNGRGERVPLEVFERSWATSDHFMVSTTGHIDPPEPTFGWLASADHAQPDSRADGDSGPRA